jgi:transposase
MSQETLAMSQKERERLVVLERVKSGELLLKEAAWEMGLSERQTVRLNKRYKRDGAEGLVHQSRGLPSNRRYPPEFKRRVLEIYRERYSGFGPTLACEKMAECEGIDLSHETLRRWLIEEGLWQCGAKERVHRRQRKRRERFGELLQIDGSDHCWFEDRGPRSTLLVLVDDATGRVRLHMAEAETTRAALTVLHKWVKAYGVPEALYADRRTVYFTEAFLHEPERRGDPEVFTDFMQVTDRLNIAMIAAYSPQAKGRVERMNGTLQDRLVKELRLRGISTIEGANAMLDAFADDLNRRFAREPLRPADAHRAAPRTRAQWEAFFCSEESRVVQKDNTVSFKGQLWQILKQPEAPRPGEKALWRRPLFGEAGWFWQGKRLRTRCLGPKQKPASRQASPTRGGQPPHPRDLSP